MNNQLVNIFGKRTLSEEELAERAKTLAGRNLELEALEAQKKEMAAQIKAQIEAAKAEIARLSQVLSSGHEYGMIECRPRYDITNRMVSFVSTETGDVVERRRMTEKELSEQQQLELPIE